VFDVFNIAWKKVSWLCHCIKWFSLNGNSVLQKVVYFYCFPFPSPVFSVLNSQGFVQLIKCWVTSLNWCKSVCHPKAATETNRIHIAKEIIWWLNMDILIDKVRQITSTFLAGGWGSWLSSLFPEADSINTLNPLRTKLYPYDLTTQFVPRSKHTLPRFKTR
jgi:hypothetical protein